MLQQQQQQQIYRSHQSSWFFFVCLLAGGSITSLATYIATRNYFLHSWHVDDDDAEEEEEEMEDENNHLTAHEQLILHGTPLIELRNLSKLLKRRIFVKMESMNPGGTGKDRAAWSMLRDAVRQGLLPPPVSIDNRNINEGSSTENDNHHLLSNINDLQLHESTETTTTTKDSLSENGTKTQNYNSINDQNGNNSNDASIQQQKQEHHQSQVQHDVLMQLIYKAMSRRHVKTNGLVVEGTSGSTGIALATLCVCKGYGCIVVLPDDQATEKQVILQSLGAIVHVVPTASISSPKHYVNIAKKIVTIACASNNMNEFHDNNCNNNNDNKIYAVFINQFENLSNYNIHYTQTGPEICSQIHQLFQKEKQQKKKKKKKRKQQQQQQQQRQHDKNWWWRRLFSSWNTTNATNILDENEIKNNNNNKIDAFVMSSGTGGTISGVGKYLKECHNPNIRIVLADPPGSVLYNKVEHGIAYAVEQSERTIKKHRYDTIAEGIGLDRITSNFQVGINDNIIDTAVSITDQEAIDMAHWILQVEGLWIGSSSAMNLVGTVRYILATATATTTTNNNNNNDDDKVSLPINSNIVTMICDGGQRHVTRFWNKKFITQWGLVWPTTDEGDGEDVDRINDNDDTTLGTTSSSTKQRKQQRIPECLRSILQ